MYSTFSEIYSEDNLLVAENRSKFSFQEKPAGSFPSDPSVWGPHLWYYLHNSASNYPARADRETKEHMKNYLCSLFITIPCKNCSEHYKRYIEANKSRLDDVCSTRRNLFNFIVDIHNWVNERIGKEQMSYERAREIYGCTY